MAYTTVFGGTTIYPSDVSYLALALGASTTLEWPLENAGGNPAARIIDVTATGAYSIDLPDATLTGAGQTILFNNLSGSSSSFTVRDYTGATLATVAVGEQWQVYLAATTTTAGTWRVFRYGASTATVQASALAGYGLTVTSNTLSQSVPVTVFTSTPRTVLDTERGTAFVWDGSGAGTLNLPTAASVGNNFFINARNEGGGDLTVDPSGGETINTETTIALRPGDSATLITDGVEWFTIGLGQEAVFAFDYTSIDLTAASSPYTLSGAELNRIAYKFIGTLTANMEIIVPPTIQQYWVDNQTTGSYTLTIKTASGSGSSVTQGGRGIYYCDGSSVVNASTAGISVPLLPSEGGTGQVSYTVGDLLYASGATTLSRLADVATGNALISGGVGVIPSWGKIGLTTHVSGTLPVANGGTGSTTAADARTALGLGSMATQAASAVAITGGTISGLTSLGATGSITAAGGISTSGANINTVGGQINLAGGNLANAVITGTTVVAIANGGTGATTDSGARTALGLGTIATQAASSVSISGGTITGITDLAVADGGTGASTAAAARVNLLPSYAGNGGKVLALNGGATDTEWISAGGTGTVTSVAASGGTTGLSFSGSPITASGTLTLSGTLAIANGGTGATTDSGARTALGLGSLATLSSINNGNWSGTVLSVANGGTGASDAATARSNLSAAASGANTDITALDQDVTITATGTVAANSIGYRGLPASTQSTGSGITLALSDAGRIVPNTTGGWTIPANGSVAFPVGTSIVLYNDSGSSQNIAITTDTMYLAGTATTGTRALAQRGLATIVKVASTTWVISGAGVS